MLLDEKYRMCASGWIEADNQDEAVRLARIKLADLENKEGRRISVGVDAPRTPLERPRTIRWDKRRQRWSNTHALSGRHCELALKSLRIANPQWTQLKGRCPGWMRLGFNLFQSLQEVTAVYEVFPSASYQLLQGNRDLRLTIDLADFFAGPKDMLDASVAAVTVGEYVAGRGTSIGGGDGLGEIVLPRPFDSTGNSGVLQWPQ